MADNIKTRKKPSPIKIDADGETFEPEDIVEPDITEEEAEEDTSELDFEPNYGTLGDCDGSDDWD